jgi:hypothetical protein
MFELAVMQSYQVGHTRPLKVFWILNDAGFVRYDYTTPIHRIAKEHKKRTTRDMKVASKVVADKVITDLGMDKL